MTESPRFGLGFRTAQFAELSAHPGGVDWLELLSDSYLAVGGPRRAMLERLRASFPIALHGVSLGIANTAPPRAGYVEALRALVDLVEPEFVSDHLCWTGIGGLNSHDLLPVAYTREVLALVTERVARVQDALGRRILLENASAYVKFRADDMTEAELLAAVCERTGCGVLLDVNNLFVNAMNLGTDPRAALDALAPRHVGYLHIAGHTALPSVRIDTHGAPVSDDVWRLFEHAVRRFPRADVILERDDAIPPLEESIAELATAREHWRAAGADMPSETNRSDRVVPAQISSRDGVSWCETQRAFWASLEQRGRNGARASIAAALDARAPVPPQVGLRVYRDAYAQMPRRALAANFPTLARTLSRRDFAALCDAFLRAHPSESHDYVRFGASLAEFLAAFALADAYEIAGEAFADIARLEQAQLEVQEAPEERERVSPNALAALAPTEWPEARFEFSPALRVVEAQHDILPAIRAVASGERPALPKRGLIAYLVARDAGRVHTQPLRISGARALAALCSGATFSEATENAGGEDAAPAAACALAIASARGALRAIRAPEARGRRASA